MDDTNKKILRLLHRDGRMSFAKIGEEIGISRVAVKKRVAKMEQDGIITGYTVISQRKDLYRIHFDIQLKNQPSQALCDFLNQSGLVTEMFLMTGNVLQVKTQAPDISELKYLADRLCKEFENELVKVTARAVKERIKDPNGGIGYEYVERRDFAGNECLPERNND